MKKSIDQLQKEFQEFDAELDYNLDLLIGFANANPDKYLPLDYTVISLQKVENIYSDFLDKKIDSDITEENMIEWIAAYLGNTLIREFGGGTWKVELDEQNDNFGLPSIYKIPGLAKNYGWSPYIAIKNYRRNRRHGIFTTAIISHYDWINKN